MLYIGIKSGEDTGFAVWNSEKRKLEDVNSVDFWQCINNIHNYKKFGHEITVVMENLSFKKVLSNKNGNDAITLSIAKHNTNLISDYCKQNGIKHRLIKPCDNDWTPGYFKELTGITAKVKRVSINAVKLVWGM
jgi:hypothetical protein